MCLRTDKTPCPKVLEIFLRIPHWSSWYPRLNKLKTYDNSVCHLVLPLFLVLVEQHSQFERSLYHESFVLNHSLSSVVFKSRSLLRPTCSHQPITLPQVTATPFVNTYTV